jgi:hypothetical protein
MHDVQNIDGRARHTVNNNVRSAGNDKLSRAARLSRSAEPSMICSEINSFTYSATHPISRIWIIGRNIIPDSIELAIGRG